MEGYEDDEVVWLFLRFEFHVLKSLLQVVHILREDLKGNCRWREEGGGGEDVGEREEGKSRCVNTTVFCTSAKHCCYGNYTNL